MRHQSSLLFWGLLGVSVAFCLIFITPAQPVQGQTDQLFVSMWGGGISCEQWSPCSIETAQDLWGFGDTIYIQQGDYYLDSSITINQSITLVGGWDGAEEGEVVVDPEKYPPVFMDVHTPDEPFFDIGTRNIPQTVVISGIYFNFMSSGGITVGDGSTLVIERNYFARSPWAVEVGEDANIIAVNNIFADCGRAFYTEEFIMDGGSIHLVNNTFTDMLEVIDVRGHDVSAVNNIFSNISWEVINQNSGEVDASHNLLYTSETPGALPAGSWITGDPQFVDPDSGNFHIGAASSARDAGTTPSIPGYGTLTVDYDGEARPNEGGVDIGADEYYEPDLVPTFFPLFLN